MIFTLSHVLAKVFLFCCFLLVFGLSVSLAQRTVFVNAAAPVGGGGATWAGAYNSLEVALGNAQVGDSLFMAGGTYRTSNNRSLSFFIVNGTMIYGGFGGTENYLFQRSGALGPTILSGDLGIPGNNSDNNYTVIDIRNTLNNGITTTLLDQVEVRDGNENRVPGPDPILPIFNLYWGGGVFAVNASFDMVNCTIANCVATSGGGGFFAQSCPQVNLINCTFLNNQAIGGGPMGNEGGLGGAIYQTFSTIGLVNGVIRGNRARLGGGVYYDAGSRLSTGRVPLPTPGPATGLGLNRLLVENNQASEDGGGMYVSNGLIEQMSIFFGAIYRNNTAQRDGGGVFIQDRETPFGFSLFEGNRAIRNGGGMAITGTNSTKKVSLINTIFSNNTAQFGGGVAYLNSSAFQLGVLELRHCSILDNTAPGASAGGGLYLSNTSLQTINTLFWGNRANAVLNSYQLVGSGAQLYHNLIEDAACPPGTVCNAGCLFNQDPQLLGPASPYSPIGTLEDTPYVPLPDSPLVDRGGSPSDFGVNPIPFNDYEQDYLVAHRTCVPDIGAVEMRRMLRQGGTWNDPNGWTPQSRSGGGVLSFSVPTTPQNILIDRVTATLPASLTTAVACNIYLNNCRFTMGNDSRLTVGRDFAVTGQSTQFDPGNGTATVTFVPRNDCTVGIPPSVSNYINHEFLDNQLTFNYLLVQNPGNPLVAATSFNIRVRRLLDLEQNNFITQDNLTLLSTQNFTAMVINRNTNVVDGQVLVQRFVEAYPERIAGQGYTYVSRPVLGGTIGADVLGGGIIFDNPGDPYFWQNPSYTIANFPNAFRYVEGENQVFEGGAPAAGQAGWRGITSGEPYVTGRGYCVNIPGGFTFRSVGILTNGNLSVGPITRGNAPQSGWNLIGNPYPSPIDWDAVYNLGSNSTVVDRTILRRIATGRFSGAWAYFPANIPGGIGINGGKDLAQGQGFLVRARTPDSSGNLSFDNSVRPTAYQKPQFYRPEEAENLGCSGIVKFEAGNSTVDQTVVYFMPRATNGWDEREDILRPFYNSADAPDLLTRVGERPTAYNALPPLTENTSLPVYFKAVRSGQQYFRIAEMKFFAAGTAIYLEDKTTGAFHNLTTAEYAFQANRGLEANRFVLHFRRGGSAQAPIGYLHGFPNPAKSVLNLMLNHPFTGQISIQITDVFGKIIRQSSQEKGGQFWEKGLDIGPLNQGVYVLTVDLGNEKLVYRFVKE